MKDFLKAVGLSITLTFAVIGFSGVIVIITSPLHTEVAFTEDYIRESKIKLDDKIEAFKDSSMKHVDQPKLYNRYVDSSNHYIIIYNYLNVVTK